MIEKAGKKAGVKILIAEDEMIVAEDLALTLQDLGYLVAGMASTGEGAVQLAKESKPTLVLMDIKMAGDLDGIEASEQIRTRLDIPVIFLTAYDEVDVLRRAKRTEPYGFVAKPFSHHILKITIETALYKHAADRRVRESEARRAKAEELAGLHSWEWDIKTGHLVWSDESYRAFGLHPRDPELTFDTFLNSVHADDRERLRKALEDALDTIRPYDLEFRIVQSNGQERFLHSRGEIQRDEDGKPIRMQGMALDITDRKHAEEARRQSDDRFRMVYESGMLGMGFCDPDGRVLDANDAYLDMLRFSREDLLNNRINWREITPPEHLPADLNGLEELMVNGRCTPYEKEYLLLDGTRVPVIIGGALLPGGSSEVIAFALDITDRKRAEEALRESEDRYRDLVENINDLICTHDLHGNLLFVNQAPAKLLGYAPSYMVGTNLRSYLAPEVRDQFEAYLAAIRKDGQASGLMLVQTKGGEKRIWEYHNTLRTEDVADPTVRGIARDITDQRRAEAMLKASEQRLALALAGANLGIWEWDLVTGKALWSERTLQVLGYEPSEFEPNLRNWKKLIHSEDWPRVSENLNLHIEGKLPLFEAEYRILNKSGDWQWVQGRGKAIGFDADGKPIRMAGVVADISDRKKSEEALRESREQLETIFETSPAGIILVSPEGLITFANQKMGDLFSRRSEDLLGTPYVDLVHPSQRSIGCEKMKALMAGEIDQVSLERRYRAADGREFLGHLSGRRILRECGGLEGLVGIITDITDRKKAEEALLESEERYRQITESSLTGIFLYQDGRSVYANRRLAEMVGYGPEEILNIPFLEAVHPDDRHKVQEMAKARLSGQPVPNHYQLRLLHKNGHMIWTEVLSHRIDYEGRPAILGNIADVTESRILRQQLFQAQKMEAVGILAGGVAHDFNNLLHIIAGHAELLEMELAEKDMRFGEVDAIRQTAKRGADLVKQILTFSRRVDTNFESINLNEDVQDTERLLYRTIPKMIEIDLQLEEGLRPVRADSTQIEQMLINLAINAKDAMPEGGKLTIETKNVQLDEQYCRSHVEMVPGQYVLLRVSDTGYGMEEHVLQHIFEPFFTTKGLADGTGLGLATVFGIVKMHGGHITCESEVGKGTTFAIYFPVAEAAKPEQDQKQEVSAVEGGTEKILVVDDEPLIRDLAKRMLETAGYSVITAGSGREGIEIYAQHKSEIALVILDLIMPEMGGKQCLEELFKINPQVRALIASGFAVKGDTKDFLDTEAKGIVPKPFNMRELLRAVRHVLDGG